MELLDRYLSDVRPLLPAEQRDDIIAELADNIRAQVEDKEAELGRPLDEAELEAVLRGHGSPLAVARHYRKDDRTLAFGRQWIGPELFPIYWKVLQINMWLGLAVTSAIFVGLWAAGKPNIPSGMATTLIIQLLIQFGIVTLVFMLIDEHLKRFPGRWSGRGGSCQAPETKGPPRVPRAESIAQFICLGIFLGAWGAFVQSGRLAPGPHVESIRLGPVFGQIYGPIELLMLAGMVQAAVNLFRPEWIRFRAAVRAVSGVIWLLILAYTLGAGDWVVPAVPAGEAPPKLLGLVATINHWFFYGLLAFGIACVPQVVYDVHRYYRGERPGTAEAVSPAAFRDLL